MLTARLIVERALELGFDLIGFAPAGPTPGADRFLRWLSLGYAGEMGYLERSADKRADPRLALPGARTMILAGASYDTLAVPSEILTDPARGRIARYAWGADYHDILTPRLRQLGEFVARESRAWVDTGPVLERAWAEQCGLGFIGKNTCLIHRTRGSWFFLGAIVTPAEIQPDESASDDALSAHHSQSKVQNRKSKCGCGNCARCLVACPTQAFPEPFVLDARRCISYLTIELKGSIPLELRPLMGNWIFGCDICQEVCPYVRQYSRPTREPAFYPSDPERAAPRLLDVLTWDRAAFNSRFKGTAVLRAKRRGLLRNACVAAGNWGSPQALPALTRLLEDEEPLVREHAAWAIARINGN
ncbi:MAG: tRNA epoxyqueuosine(34) reductase QueG [Candidatus Roseilinea sp.]|uniref:tRNA epoxyqueuosine(34) reductase QueG n=1 Tax=Candidatus Roseilinea sp. TaxID=2838777 RepID=UPI00404B8D05